MPAGDHLKVVRGGEVDHAIDVGDRTVLRWRAGVGVERVERARFAPDGARLEVVLHRERIFRAPLVVARAFSRFAEAAYRAMFQSAEQFAVWCKSAQLPPVAAEARARKGKKGAKAGATKARAAPRAAKSARARPARKGAPRKAAKRAARARPSRKAAPKKQAARKVARARPGKRAARKGRR